MNFVKPLFLLLTLKSFSLSAAISNSYQDTLNLSFSQAEEIMDKENVVLKSQYANVSVSEEEMHQERLFENPEITIQHNINNPVTGHYFEFGKEGQSDIQISQRIYIGGQRAERIRIAKANVLRSEAELANVKRLLRRDLFSAMTEIYYCQKKISILQNEVDVIDKILQPYEVQLQKGNVSHVEIVRIKSQKIQLNKEINDIEVELLTKQSDLRLLLGMESNSYISPQINEPLFLNHINSLSVSDITSGIESRPDLEMAKHLVAMAEHNVKLQKANGLPELKIEGEWDKNGNIGHNYFGAGVSLTLPIFNRNQGTVKAARHNLESRRLEKEYLHNEVANEKMLNWSCLQKLYVAVDESGKVADEMSTQILHNAQQQFLNRNISLLELIDHLETYKEVQFTHLDNKLELIKAFVSLDL